MAADDVMVSISAAMRDALSNAIDTAATEFIFLTDTTPPAAGGPLIVYMNQAMLQAFGYAESDVIGRNPSMFWGPETDMEAVRELRRSITGHRTSGGEYAAYDRNGSIIWVRFSGRVLNIAGLPAHWIAIGSDITQSRLQLQQIQELSEFRGDLIAMLAHDFGGPLTVVSGFAELLLEVGEGEVPSAERADILRTIRREAQRLANVAIDTLTVSRMEFEHLTIRRQPFDVVELLHEIVDLYADRGVIALHSPVTLSINADRLRIRQALDNLVGNAVKYSPNETPVVVDCRLDCDEVVIAVRDQGIGIPLDQLHSIFERYARGSNARIKGIPGTGFGLYLAEAIVRHHGGRIEAQSTLDAGSTFTLRLPCESEVTAPA